MQTAPLGPPTGVQGGNQSCRGLQRELNRHHGCHHEGAGGGRGRSGWGRRCAAVVWQMTVLWRAPPLHESAWHVQQRSKVTGHTYHTCSGWVGGVSKGVHPSTPPLLCSQWMTSPQYSLSCPRGRGRGRGRTTATQNTSMAHDAEHCTCVCYLLLLQCACQWQPGCHCDSVVWCGVG